jgi:hypothetical protein
MSSRTARAGRCRTLLSACVLAAAGQGLGTVLSGRAVEAFSLAPLERLALGVTTHALGLAFVALAALLVAGWRPSFPQPPDRRGRRLVVATVGTLATLRAVTVLSLLLLGVPFAGNAVTSLAEHGLRVSLFVLMVLSVLAVAPAEELLFRRVIQRRLSGVVSRPAAVIGASVLFALAHVQTSWAHTPDLGAVAVTLAAIFGVSLFFGGVYALTDDLTVPVLVHGFYNVAVLALLYVGVP